MSDDIVARAKAALDGVTAAPWSMEPSVDNLDEATVFAEMSIAATICIPLLKQGRLTALMAVHDVAARTWTDEELTLRFISSVG